jgi:DNA-binding transcriptional LysR family regulator
MHATALRYFEAVVEEGSIRKAAERLHISPSAVNRQILKLEENFETLLFERRPQGLKLTDAGQLVLQHSRSTLQNFERLKGEIDYLRGRISGQVTIATLDSLTMHFLPVELSKLMSKHPDIRVRVATGDPMKIVHSIARGNADLGITFSSKDSQGVIELASVDCPLCAILSPSHPLADKRSLTLPECSTYPLIFNDNSSSIRYFFGEEMDSFMEEQRPIVVTNTLLLVKGIILDSVRIAFFTRLGFSDELESGELVAIPLKAKSLSVLRLCIIIPSDRSPTIAAKVTGEYLKRSLVGFVSKLG